MNNNLFDSTNVGAGSMDESATKTPTMDDVRNSILLIEDNPGDARLIELFLGDSDLSNCEVVNKTTLKDGMDALEEKDFVAILLDLTLPDSRGFETLERLLEKFPDNNVIVLTGLIDKDMGIKAVKAGAQDFLIKGAFDPAQLSKALRYSIERSSVLKRLEETQRIANIGNWEYNTLTKSFDASDEVYRIFGYTPRKDNFTIENVQDPNHVLYVLNDIHNEAINTHTTVKKDLVLARENGETVYVFIQCSFNKNDSNKVIINGVIQNITERKTAEQQSLKSQERYQDIFSKSKDALFISTIEGNIIDFNEATLNIFGITKEELKTRDVYSFFSPPEAKVKLLSNLKNNEPIKDFEIEIERNDGSKRYCLITATMFDDSGDSQYTGAIRDITEQKQADELRKARDLANQSAKLKEQFIASISHEMRTPMNAILGMSNLVLKTDMNEEQFGYINSIKQSSEILLGIINDILEISTLQNGKVKFEYKPFDLHEILANMVSVMRYKIKEKELDFQLDIDPSIPSIIEGDKLRLNQVLYNLVGNAIKFTDAGFVKIRIVNVNENANTIQLKFYVEDTGIGIPADKVDAVFDTFTRIRTKDRLYEGTGLGLSIAKSLVEQQGGKIGLTSVLGEGSTFFFDMIFEKNNSDITADANVKEEVFELADDNNIRLLLVEDHKMNQLVARKTLQKKWPNIQIMIADNGQIAIDILKENTFDIILMDIQMPVMDGYETTTYIRKEMPEAAKLPILAMTAHANISKDESFKEYGLDDFVLKPFEPEQLFQKIAKYVLKTK